MRALIIPVLFLSAAGLDGCKPVQTAPAPPPPPRLGPIEAPENVVAEVLVRDPEALIDAVAVATGNAELSKKTLFASDKDLAQFVELVDLHSSAGAVLTGDPAEPATMRIAIAVKLKDPKGARARATEAVQKGKLKVEDSPTIRAKIYPSEKSAFAFIGEALVVADKRETIETVGRWIAKEGTEGTPPHDVTLRVPLAQHAVKLRNELKKKWNDELQKDPDAATADPFMKELLAVLAGFGDVQLSLDVEKDDAIVDLRLGASGMFSQWLAKYPAGPARSILTMPKSSSAFVVRFPDAVSNLFKTAVDDAAKKSPPSKESEDFRALAKSIGHEIAFATNEKHKGTEWKTNEAMLRLDLVDPTGARNAIKSLITDVAGKPDRKINRTPWAKGGADGESIQVVSGTDKYDARWAVKGNFLYVDVAWDGKVSLLDNALDPTGKTLLGANPRAKVFADHLPNDGLIFAYYAETPKAPKLEELGAVPSLAGVRWGFATAASNALTSQWNVPLADLAAWLSRGSEKTEHSEPVGIVPPASSSAAPMPSSSAPPKGKI
jgi:hypothetical protein